MIFALSWNGRPQIWILLPLAAGAVGLLMVIGAFAKGWESAGGLGVVGALHLAVSAYALSQEIPVRFADPLTGDAARKRSRAELATLLLAAPYCVLMFCCGVFDLKPEVRAVAGKPLEVRADSRSVFMPGGQTFTYTCWKDTGRGGGTCPAEARWDRLPRWPEPEHVEMDVSGREIRSLKMDGVVIVDAAEFTAGDRWLRVLLLVLGSSLAVLTIRAILHRLRLIVQDPA